MRGRFAARVQRVQKVQRVQRVVVAAPPQIKKGGRRLDVRLPYLLTFPPDTVILSAGEESR